MSSNPVFVLDSFALLAFFEDETGRARVQSVLELAQQQQARAILPVINLGEILYIIERERGLPLAQKTLATIEQLPVEILPATTERVLAAAHLKARFPVAYADAFAIAAAREFEATVLTSDPEFAAVETFVAVQWLR